MEIKTNLPQAEGVSKRDAFVFEQHYVFLSGHIVYLSEPLPVFKNLMQLGKLSNEDYLKLDVALQEAIANAVEHGNLELNSSLREEFDEEGRDLYSKLKEERLRDNRYASKFIYISAVANNGEISVTVRDEGNGFKKNADTNLTNIVETDIKLPKCSGRGLILIKSAADSVSFNEAGNQVEFKKSLK